MIFFSKVIMNTETVLNGHVENGVRPRHRFRLVSNLKFIYHFSSLSG